MMTMSYDGFGGKKRPSIDVRHLSPVDTCSSHYDDDDHDDDDHDDDHDNHDDHDNDHGDDNDIDDIARRHVLIILPFHQDGDDVHRLMSFVYKCLFAFETLGITKT